MNKIEFYKLNTLHGDEYLEENYNEKLFEYYKMGGKIYNYQIEINYDDFSKIFSTTHDILKTKLTEEEIKKAFLQYIQLLMVDARDGKNVDAKWFINCVDYLSLDILDNTFLKKCKKLIKKIKNELNDELNIKPPKLK